MSGARSPGPAFAGSGGGAATGRDTLVVGGLLALALAVRVAVVAATAGHYVLRTDALDYYSIAVSVIHGHGFGPTHFSAIPGPTAFRPPLYPLALAALFEVTGPSVTAALVAQAVVGVATVAVVGLLGWQLWGRRVALWALAVAAVYPPLVLAGSSLVAESVLNLFAVGSVAAAVQHRRAPRGPWWAVLAGALAGLVALDRTNGILLVIPLVILVWGPSPRLAWAALRPPVLVLVAAVAVVVPWVVRDAVVMKAFVPITDEAGYALAGTYNATTYHERGPEPFAWELWTNDPAVLRLLVDPPVSEVRGGALLLGHSVGFALAHPAYPFEVALWNTLRSLDLEGLGYARYLGSFVGYGPTAVMVGVYGFYAAALVAVGGALTAAARRAPLALWLVPVVLFLPTVFEGGTSRYRVPAEPYVVLLAALALDWAAGRRDRSPTRA